MKLFQKPLALLLAAALSGLLFTACSSQTNYLTDAEGKPVKVSKVATIDGKDVSLEEFRYYFLSSKTYYEQMFSSMSGGENGAPADPWADNAEMVEMVKEQALQSVVNERVTRAYAKENNIELSIEDKKAIDDNVKSAIDQLGGRPQFKAALEEQFMTEKFYRSMLESQLLQQKIQTTLIGPGGRLAPSEEEVKTYFSENYLHAKHILISTQGITDEAEIAKKKETADKALERAKAGENFDALVTEYGEDPGMQQSPDGYYFPEGQMVAEFYEGAKALAENGVSELVQSDFGWHIIQRLPIAPDYYETNKATLESEITANLAGPKLSAELQAKMEAAVIEKAPEYESINMTNLK